MKRSNMVVPLILGLAFLGALPGSATGTCPEASHSPYFYMADGDPAIDRLPLKEMKADVLTLDPMAGWVVPDGSHVIAPACAGVTLTARRVGHSMLLAAILVPGAYLGLTVMAPLLNGTWRNSGGQYGEHVMMVLMVTLVTITAFAGLFLPRRAKRGRSLWTNR